MGDLGHPYPAGGDLAPLSRDETAKVYDACKGVPVAAARSATKEPLERGDG